MCPPLAHLQGTAVVGGDPSSDEICECSLSLVQSMTQLDGKEQCHWSDLRSGGVPRSPLVCAACQKETWACCKSQRCSRLGHANLPHKRMSSRRQVWTRDRVFLLYIAQPPPESDFGRRGRRKSKVVSRPVYSLHGCRRRGAVTMKSAKAHATMAPYPRRQEKAIDQRWGGVCVCVCLCKDLAILKGEVRGQLDGTPAVGFGGAPAQGCPRSRDPSPKAGKQRCHPSSCCASLLSPRTSLKARQALDFSFPPTHVSVNSRGLL